MNPLGSFSGNKIHFWTEVCAHYNGETAFEWVSQTWAHPSKKNLIKLQIKRFSCCKQRGFGVFNPLYTIYGLITLDQQAYENAPWEGLPISMETPSSCLMVCQSMKA